MWLTHSTSFRSSAKHRARSGWPADTLHLVASQCLWAFGWWASILAGWSGCNGLDSQLDCGKGWPTVKWTGFSPISERVFPVDFTIRIYHDCVQRQGNAPECQRFVVHDEACRVLDVAKSLTRGWISLSLYKVVVIYFSPTTLHPHNKISLFVLKTTSKTLSA